MIRSPLKYIGAKSASAVRILAAFPPAQRYTTYVEPCGGAAWVLLARPASWGHLEVYNDLNDDLVNFWQQVQEHADELAARLAQLPYSRALYYQAHRRLFSGEPIELQERAVLWFYVLRSTSTGWIRQAPCGWNNRESNALAYRAALDLFAQVHERITHPRLIIDNRDVGRCIEEYDGPRTHFYVDPPYIDAEYYYQAGYRTHRRVVFDHARLADLLNHVRGSVALSYYPHPDLDRWYPADRWQRIRWQQRKTSAIAEGAQGQVATELLLCNYEPTGEVMEAVSLWEEDASEEVSA